MRYIQRKDDERFYLVKVRHNGHVIGMWPDDIVLIEKPEEQT